MFRASKKVTVKALWEVNQKPDTMKSNPDPQNGTPQRSKKENVKDIISKSFFKSIINRPQDVDINLFNYGYH